jgi:hypothetical protein
MRIALMPTRITRISSIAVLALVILCSASAVAAKRTLRVMTYNIHVGVGMDKKLDLQRIADVINREQPDLVGLQEVDRGVKRTEGKDEIAELAALTRIRSDELACSNGRPLSVIPSSLNPRPATGNLAAAIAASFSASIASSRSLRACDRPRAAFSLASTSARRRLPRTSSATAGCRAPSADATSS